MKRLLTILPLAILLAVSATAQTSFPPANTSQITNMVVNGAYMSPAGMYTWWTYIGMPYVNSHGGGGGTTYLFSNTNAGFAGQVFTSGTNVVISTNAPDADATNVNWSDIIGRPDAVTNYQPVVHFDILQGLQDSTTTNINMISREAFDDIGIKSYGWNTREAYDVGGNCIFGWSSQAAMSNYILSAIGGLPAPSGSSLKFSPTNLPVSTPWITNAGNVVYGTNTADGTSITNVNAATVGGLTPAQLVAQQLTYYVWGSSNGIVTNPYATKLATIQSPSSLVTWTSTVPNIYNGTNLGYASIARAERPASLQKGLAIVHLPVMWTGSGVATHTMLANITVLESNGVVVTNFVGGLANVTKTVSTHVDFEVPICCDVSIASQNRDIVVYFTTVSGWGGDTIQVLSQDGELCYFQLSAVAAGVYQTVADMVNYVPVTNNVPSYASDVLDPTGWVTNDTIGTFVVVNNGTNINLSLTNATPMKFYMNGRLTNITSVSATIPTNQGNWFIYYRNPDMALVITNVAWSLSDGQIATLYASGTNPPIVVRETHGASMDWATHRRWHLTEGAKIVSGFDFTTNGARGALFTTGQFFDEDILCTSATTQTNFLVASRDDGTPYMVYRGPRTSVIITNPVNGSLQYDSNGVMADVATGGGGSYTAYWFYGMPNINSNSTVVVVAGQTQGSLTAVRATNPPTLLPNFFSQEAILLARGIWRNSATISFIEWADFRRSSLSGVSVPSGITGTFTNMNATIVNGQVVAASDGTGGGGTDIGSSVTLIGTNGLNILLTNAQDSGVGEFREYVAGSLVRTSFGTSNTTFTGAVTANGGITVPNSINQPLAYDGTGTNILINYASMAGNINRSYYISVVTNSTVSLTNMTAGASFTVEFIPAGVYTLNFPTNYIAGLCKITPPVFGQQLTMPTASGSRMKVVFSGWQTGTNATFFQKPIFP